MASSRAPLVVLLALLATSAMAVTFEPVPSAHWGMEKSLPLPDTPVTFSLALRLRNLDQLGARLRATSDPASPRYGQHADRDTMVALTAPADETVARVREWLAAGGLTDTELSGTRGLLRVRATVGQLEQLLHTRLAYFVHAASGARVLRAHTSYELPERLPVDFVAGLHGFPPQRLAVSVAAPAATTDQVTPEYLWAQYSVTEATRAVPQSSQAVVEFAGNYYSASDLQDFFVAYNPIMVGQDVWTTFGFNPDNKTSLEANLDVQYIMAMGNFVNTSIYLQNITTNIEDAFIEYAELANSQNDPPLVHSISFGQYGGNYDNSTVQRLNVQFQMMGARGISILLASGDNGVGCNRDCSSFEFDFPSSPYITMVGATQFEKKVETGATLSSGGFSLDYWRPDYQNTAVTDYFNSGVALPPSSKYWANGRAYPDIAAAGVDVQIVQKGSKTSVSGTSCSAPIVAGLIGLINNERFLRGKSSLGFLNPFLYDNPHAFTDITVGNNQKCPIGSGCCCEGFNAAPGWDPVTGLGSPVYSKLLAAALALP